MSHPLILLLRLPLRTTSRTFLRRALKALNHIRRPRAIAATTTREEEQHPIIIVNKQSLTLLKHCFFWIKVCVFLACLLMLGHGAWNRRVFCNTVVGSGLVSWCRLKRRSASLGRPFGWKQSSHATTRRAP